MKAVGIWIRVSTEDQAQGDSPEHHEQRARMYASAKDWNVITVYHLEAISGKTVMQHSEAQRMLKDIRSGRITGLIFSKLARLARNTRELLDFADMFQTAGADLISLQESIDTSSPAGRLFYTMIAAMAQWEREEIAARVSASVPIRAKLGKPLGGAAPFGYTWQGEEGQTKELVINEHEAPIRRLMYELFKKHKRKGTVADELNERGHRTRNGSLFTDTTLGRLLADPIAKGERRANYSKSLGEGKSWQLKPESEWVILPAPAIVSKELWDECYLILSEQERKNARPARKTVHIFTGMLFCECSSKMYLPSKSKKYRCYSCGKAKISVEDIEEIYYENLKSFLLTDQHLKTFISRADGLIATKEKEIVLLKEKRKSVEEQMDKVMQLHFKKEIPVEGFKRHYEPLQQQYEQINNSLPELQGEVDFLKIEKLNGNHIFEHAQNLADHWPTLSIEGKREIVEQVTKQIVIGEEDILIKFNYTPTPTTNTSSGAVMTLPIVISATSSKYPQLPTQPCGCGA